MKIATWNVNSIKARLPVVLKWLDDATPDVVLLQETKSTDDSFPALEFEAAGYNLAIHGQKTYNGVAIFSKYPISDVSPGLPGDDSDEQARYIEAWIDGEGGGVRVASVYLPNGNPVPGEKFDYKLAWMDRLTDHVAAGLATEEPIVWGGDFNILPQDRDCFAPERFADDALARPESRARFRTMVNLGLTEAWRALHPHAQEYSYWDYQGGAWAKDNGLRIDHLLLSPQATDRLGACEIDRTPRGAEKASDHTPVWCRLEFAQS
ncbi:MAG: exodeoxyribonuclease III [Alphaproteobacteria bacterium]|nr:exodeoxyribonuclease III [Alphaproteobacteria bacterium]MCZ6764945.1 exodeoxyribonuclease III [Alphaproteobacteria bacterium]